MDVQELKAIVVYFHIPRILRGTHSVIHKDNLVPYIGSINKAMSPDLFGFERDQGDYWKVKEEFELNSKQGPGELEMDAARVEKVTKIVKYLEAQK
mmetsp:Transcript_24775/g.38564  ORF Transcript_24775/g.38564 Transcript_24775/m.38564 type:complete len:96 (-) Transcript_24775:14-301(-)